MAPNGDSRLMTHPRQCDNSLFLTASFRRGRCSACGKPGRLRRRDRPMGPYGCILRSYLCHRCDAGCYGTMIEPVHHRSSLAQGVWPAALD